MPDMGKCWGCGKELDDNDMERSSVHKAGDIKVRICEECKDAIIKNKLTEESEAEGGCGNHDL